MCFNSDYAEAREAVDAVTPQEAAELQAARQVVFVDPRPDAQQSNTGIIPGAFNVTLDDIAAGNLPVGMSDRSLHLVTSCQAGPMGAIAAHKLAQAGFGKVNYIDGGTQGWLDAGFPTLH